MGYTLTGFDDLEPGAATNLERVAAIRAFSRAGFKTWASIEPVIDFSSSLEMVQLALPHCGFFKVGLLSGAKVPPDKLQQFVADVTAAVSHRDIVYWKESVTSQLALG